MESPEAEAPTGLGPTAALFAHLPLHMPLGIHHGVPEALYHAPQKGVFSNSILGVVEKSPAHYLHSLEQAQEDTAALFFGRAFHCRVLEPLLYAQRYVLPPDFGKMQSSINRQKRDDWAVANPDVVIGLTDLERERIEGMGKAIEASPLARVLLSEGESEVTCTWLDEETGLYGRCRADKHHRPRKMVVDLKSCENASYDEFRKSIVKWRYHVQDATYRAGFAGAGEPIEHFVIVAVEKKPPHCLAIYSLDEDAIAAGYHRSRASLAKMEQAVKTDVWPGYPEEIQTMELPPWA